MQRRQKLLRQASRLFLILWNHSFLHSSDSLLAISRNCPPNNCSNTAMGAGPPGRADAGRPAKSWVGRDNAVDAVHRSTPRVHLLDRTCDVTRHGLGITAALPIELQDQRFACKPAASCKSTMIQPLSEDILYAAARRAGQSGLPDRRPSPGRSGKIQLPA